jgi:hypothetical protein
VLNFALDNQEELFPGVPIVFCSVERREIEGRHLPPKVIGVPVNFDFHGTLDLIFQLQPETKEVVCVAGTAPIDRYWTEQCRKVLDSYERAVPYRFIGTGPFSETLSNVSQLPAHSVVLYLNFLRDGLGEAYVPVEVAGLVVQRSNVPVYGLLANQLEQGLVGGAMFDFAAHGQETAYLCKKVLASEELDRNPIQPVRPNSLLVNWRAVEKWNIPENHVPKNAIVSFREPSMWEEHPRLVIGAILLSVAQTALIVALLRSLTRLHKTRRELDDRLRFERLIAEVSAKFVNVPPDGVDCEIERALDQVIEVMNLDCCVLFKFQDEKPQVLLNLVLNAFDAMQETSVHLRRVVLSTRYDAAGAVHTTVRDFGIGFSEGVKKRIFEHFFSTKKDGLGMGLAIARSIVESFGGTLDAKNAPGGGAFFYFTLPTYCDGLK